MAEIIKSVRGMNDLLPPESAKWHFLEKTCRELFLRYGYDEIRTPILESTALFQRGIGESTDIVGKEMYTFLDKKDRPMAMRPEATAACVRAYIQHSIAKQEPVTRWFYSGPMFRYERSAAGRYRQFYQIGVEAYGVAEATLEAEQISMLYELYTGLGISNLEVLINSVGSGEDRPRYREALLAFVAPFTDELCADCQTRLELNPLRILDCKVKSCQQKLTDAPSVLDSLGAESTAHFTDAKAALDALGVPYTVAPHLVRGLDYYTGTVFEIVAATKTLGSQSTIVAGGRYNGLVESLGGPPTPAVGFALGVERAILSMESPAAEYLPTPAAYIVSRGEAAVASKLALAAQLRREGIHIDFEHRQVSVKAQLKRADKSRARHIVTIGDDELATDTVRLKYVAENREETLPRSSILTILTTP